MVEWRVVFSCTAGSSGVVVGDRALLSESFFRHRQSSSPCFLATTAGPVEVGNCFHFPTANRFACHRLPTFDAASGWRKTLLNSQVLFQTMSGREENFFGMQFCIRPRRDFQHHCCHSAIKTLPTLTKWRYLRLAATVWSKHFNCWLFYIHTFIYPFPRKTKQLFCTMFCFIIQT